MTQQTITLIVGLAGITATLISSSLGLYFTANARTNPLRQTLYTKQLELIINLLQKQGRFKVFATMLLDDESPYAEQAREDIGACVMDYSKLTEEATAILSTELWIEMRRISDWMTDFLVSYDANQPLSGLKDYIIMDTKAALIARALLGVDELSQESISLFSSQKSFEKLSKISASDLERFLPKDNKE